VRIVGCNSDAGTARIYSDSHDTYMYLCIASTAVRKLLWIFL